MNRLLVGMPLYHSVPAQFFTNWIGLDQSPVVGTITVNGAYITLAMATIVEKALAIEDWDRLVIIEHDMLMARDALVRIAHYEPEHAVVGSLYFQHPPPHNALVYIQQENKAYDPITPATVSDWCADPALYRCDAVGFGLTSIARPVLENWDPDLAMFALDETFGSHDFWFCHYAQQQGHQVFVDTGVVCEHLTTMPVGLADNQRLASTIDSAVIKTFSFAE